MNTKKIGLRFTDDAVIAWLNLRELPHCMTANSDFSESLRCCGPEALVASFLEKGTDEEEIFSALSSEYGLSEEEIRERLDTLFGYFREMGILAEKL